MTFDWNVYRYDYRARIRNLNNTAQGVVKSNKFFPVFLINGKEEIFKPLSKTKPLSTPYFAYSEVFWSTIINKYFDPGTPIYKLAICENIEDDFENKYHHGTIVDSIVNPSEKLVNLYELFRDYPDPLVDISNYINYCEKFYDYRNILMSKLIRENEHIANSLATQVLLSMLKLDQNYHYENVLFKEENGEIKTIAPMIDHEFSTIFLYVDNPLMNRRRFEDAIWSLSVSKEESLDIFSRLRYEAFATLSKNLDIIVSEYRETSIEFLENLKCFISDIKTEPFILENHNYIMPFSSDNYQIGEALFKNDDSEQAIRLQQEIKQYNPNIKDVSSAIYEQVLISSQTLEIALEKRLIKSLR